MSHWALIKKILLKQRGQSCDDVDDNAGAKRDMASKTVTCGDVLDISVVGQKHTEFKEALENNQALEISAGEVQRVDGAGIQMLVALFNQATSQGTEIVWKDTSESLIDAASLLGVKEQLHLN